MSIENTQAKLMATATTMYCSPDERVAMRSGLGDSAALCDAIARQILEENQCRYAKGVATKRGQELAAIAKRCGDAIWEMRTLVKVNDNVKEPTKTIA